MSGFAEEAAPRLFVATCRTSVRPVPSPTAPACYDIAAGDVVEAGDARDDWCELAEGGLFVEAVHLDALDGAAAAAVRADAEASGGDPRLAAREACELWRRLRAGQGAAAAARFGAWRRGGGHPACHEATLDALGVAVAEKDFAFPAALRALRQFQVGAQDELLQAYAARGATVPAAALLRRQCCLMALEMLLVGPKRMLPALDDVDPGPFEADGRRLLGDGWAADYAARGYAVVDGCLDADELDALRADVGSCASR